MRLLALDAAFQPIKYISYINLQWTRKYFDIGQFSAQIIESEYAAGMVYLYTPDRRETGIVQKVEINHTIKGWFVTLSGMFLEAWLKDAVLFPDGNLNGNIEAESKRLVTAYCKAPALAVAASRGRWDNYVSDCLGQELKEAIYTGLQASQASPTMTYDYLTGKVTFDAYIGLDRTQGQSVNAFAVFSRAMNTMSESTYTADDSGYKNYAIVHSDTDTVYVDRRSDQSETRREVYIDTGGYTESEEKTHDQYLDELQTKGGEKLDDNKALLNIECKAMPQVMHYLVDWDLGDKCDVIVTVNGVKIANTARIIEVKEVFKGGDHTVTPVFGDKIPSEMERMIYR